VAGLGHDSATISAGLRVGERIVALGAHLLRDGSAVRGLDTALAAAGRAP